MHAHAHTHTQTKRVVGLWGTHFDNSTLVEFFSTQNYSVDSGQNLNIHVTNKCQNYHITFFLFPLNYLWGQYQFRYCSPLCVFKMKNVPKSRVIQVPHIHTDETTQLHCPCPLLRITKHVIIFIIVRKKYSRHKHWDHGQTRETTRDQSVNVCMKLCRYNKRQCEQQIGDLRLSRQFYHEHDQQSDSAKDLNLRHRKTNNNQNILKNVLTH